MAKATLLVSLTNKITVAIEANPGRCKRAVDYIFKSGNDKREHKFVWFGEVLDFVSGSHLTNNLSLDSYHHR